MLIIIDGYNLIFAVPELEPDKKSRDTGTARDNLISLLARYKSIKGYDVKVVFDGATYNDGNSLMHKRYISGVEIIFSGGSSDADTVIKKLASQSRDPGNICIVTSDRDIKAFVKKCGNTVVDSKKFYRDVINTVDVDKKTYDSEPRSKFDGPSEEEAEYWLRVFKNNEKDDKENN